MEKKTDVTVAEFDSIEKIRRGEWDSIVSPDRIINSYNYLLAVEKARINDFEYRYFLFYNDGKLFAHASVGITSFFLDIFAPVFIRKLLGIPRKIFPRFFQMRLIECGPVTALGNNLVSIPGREEEAGILLDRKLVSVCREKKAHLIAYRDFYSWELPDYDFFSKLGYRICMNLPNTFMKVFYRSFDEFLDILTSRRKHEIRHHIAAFVSSGCTIEKITDYASLAPLLESLWHQTFSHSREYQREILNREYFSGMSSLLGERSFILLCRKQSKPLGFTMFLDSGETLVSTYCGMDYSENRDSHVYFMLFYESIKETIRLGKKNLELGVTNYNPKIELGAHPEPLYMFARSLNPFLNTVLIRAFQVFSSSPRFNKRKIFNSRYFTRYSADHRIFLLYSGRKLRVLDLSEKGVSVEGELCFKQGKNFQLLLVMPERISVMVRAKSMHCVKKAEGLWKTGFYIKKIPPDYIIQWAQLLGHFSGDIRED